MQAIPPLTTKPNLMHIRKTKPLILIKITKDSIFQWLIKYADDEI